MEGASQLHMSVFEAQSPELLTWEEDLETFSLLGWPRYEHIYEHQDQWPTNLSKPLL